MGRVLIHSKRSIRDFVHRPMVRRQAEIAEGQGDHASAETWREIAAAARQ